MADFWNSGSVRLWLWPAIVIIGSVISALIVHLIVFALAKRISGRTGSVIYHSLLRRAEAPTRLIFPLLAVMAAIPLLPVRSQIVAGLRRAAGLGVIAAVAWVIILCSQVLADTTFARYRTDISDNLTARRVRTQMGVLRHIFNLIVIVITIGVMLMTFPAVQQVGASLLASAGIAGIIVGMAMKPSLSNIIAGIQIAITGPIRIDDVVIVGTEWGWIEEILTTYVVVRTWDLRRLVVPLSYFIENTFQNWTLNSADLLAYVYIYCDYRTPLEELRQEFRRVLEASPLWDKKVCVLQVTDTSERTMQLRALTSAADSSKAWDLKCLVREKLIQFLLEKYPESLPTVRIEYPGGKDQPPREPGAQPASGPSRSLPA